MLEGDLPEDVRIGAILRKDKVIIPRSNFIFEKKSETVLALTNDCMLFLAKIKKRTIGRAETFS